MFLVSAIWDALVCVVFFPVKNKLSTKLISETGSELNQLIKWI